MSKKIYNKLKNIDIDKEIKLYNEYLISLPLEDCNNCKGKGKKNKKDCVVCTNEYSKQDGIPIGKQKNFQTSYFLDKDTFKTFVKFCKESIGFNIN